MQYLSVFDAVTKYINLAIYYDSPITRVLPGNHPSLQPRAPYWGAWIKELT